jgi:hypothetical protein
MAPRSSSVSSRIVQQFRTDKIKLFGIRQDPFLP